MKLYRYFYLGEDPFAEISDLKIEPDFDLLRYRNLIPSNYNREYVVRRFETEKALRKLFVEKGGKPQRKNPYYLTLGNCDAWFLGKKHCFGSMVFDMEEFDPKTVSFTYGDSIPTFMERFDDGKEYRKQVYTLDEIRELIDRYGYPQDWNAMEQNGPENYIEAQVWSEDPIRLYRSDGVREEYVPRIAERMMRARGFWDDRQIPYSEGIRICRESPHWTWFFEKLRDVNTDAFQPNPVHGLPHGLKCALMAVLLAVLEGLESTDARTLILAALYHDIGRTRYDRGRSHGQLGAELVHAHIAPGEMVNQAALEEAIRNHDQRDCSGEPHLSVLLKDLDSLDYLRLGFGFYQPSYLRTKTARRLIQFALEMNIYVYLQPDEILKLAGRIEE